MKNLVTTVLMIAATPALALDKDKEGHMVAGTLSGGLAYVMTPVFEEWFNMDLDPVNVACVTSAGVGIAKEAYDATGKGQVEALDFVATAAPWCAAAGVKWFVSVDYERIDFGVKIPF